MKNVKQNLTQSLRKVFAAALSAVLALYPALASAAVPKTFIYQGTLRQDGILKDGTAVFIFRITNDDGSTEYWTSGSTTAAVSAT